MKKRRIGSTILLVLLLLLGFGLLLYPRFADWWNTRRAQSLVTEYEAAIVEKDSSEIENMRALAIAYNKTLVGSVVPDIFAELQLPPNAEYDYVLNPVGNGFMGRVEIPLIGQNIPIYHYTTNEILEKGAGHLAGSSVPIGGEDTHSVITAHRGLPSAKLFTDLNLVKEGDVFYIHVLEETLAYEVDQIQKVLPYETASLAIEAGHDYCTLVTCDPYAVNTHRILVRGHRIPYEEVQYQQELQKTAPVINTSTLIPTLICVGIGLALAGALILLLNKFSKRREEKKIEEDEESGSGDEDSPGDLAEK